MSKGQYLLYSTKDQQVTPIDDGWLLVHHTEVKSDTWWAIRHKCDDGTVHGMAFITKKTRCHGCHEQLPSEIEGFITLLQWER